jgi:uncharacterized UPF0146 family protein
MQTRKKPHNLDVSYLQLTPDIRWAYATYRRLAARGEVGANHVRMNDYKRWSFIYGMLRDNCSLIEVGIGAGQFCNAAAKSRRFVSIVGVDIKRHSALTILSKHWTFATCDITSPSFPLLFTADCVVCLQTLAYLPDKQLHAAIENLVQAATKQLIITLPLSNAPKRPHKQAFTLERASALFPNALVTVATIGDSTPWCAINVDRTISSSH